MAQQFTTEQKIFHTLRIATAMCFIGHGVFGIITKQIWCNYFAVFGIGQTFAYKLMPVVGSIDISFGIIMLVYPIRAVALWLVGWGLVTASLRPLSGEPIAELIERAGNFGAPLALLLLAGRLKNSKQLFARMTVNDIDSNEKKIARIKWILRIVVFLLLTGHGWLNLIHKKGLIDQYTRLGFSNPAAAAQAVGMFEIAAAILVLIKPIPALLILLFTWKMATELFYPHYEIFEWIERGGSYGCLLALWFATKKNFNYNLLEKFSLKNNLLQDTA